MTDLRNTIDSGLYALGYNAGFSAGMIEGRKKGVEEAATVTSSPFVPGEIDRGIKRAVDILDKCGIETYESCEGGQGHAYSEPTVRFYGVPEAGWRALSVCLAHGFPIASLKRVWDVLDSNEPTGPYWEITFRERVYTTGDAEKENGK